MRKLMVEEVTDSNVVSMEGITQLEGPGQVAEGGGGSDQDAAIQDNTKAFFSLFDYSEVDLSDPEMDIYKGRPKEVQDQDRRVTALAEPQEPAFKWAQAAKSRAERVEETSLKVSCTGICQLTS
ncbi:hypothetical protein NDU88_006074 [Pleurodeles waltl]|uniref:Uncharacterized protein n=1 Tax=Pleurodeles waltl TaxID=8319 RepID=A0AAV7VNQ2_PLEWA|nr:hypothetical protein NDU88_006074 [Pleurodeles waltl]